MPIATIALDFDPLLRLGDVTIRWQTVALAGIVFASLALAALLARRAGLRPDDLLFVVVGVVPGAVVFGRLGYVLGHVDFYAANPVMIVDSAQGAVTLSFAVSGGALTGAIVARLLGTPVRTWLHVAALPTLLAIGLGKLAMVLGGAGQGMPSTSDWATAYTGPGPWGSLAPDIPAHPAQMYEGIAVLGVLAFVATALAADVFRDRTGRAFLVGVALWAAGRVLVGFVWRDAEVIGPLRAEQLASLAVAVGCAALALVRPGPASDRALYQATPADGRPEWPDPATRPPF